MSNTTKVYPKKPNPGSPLPKYGSEDNPKMTQEEREILRGCFADIFLFGPTDNDPYTELGQKLGVPRQRAKQLYWVFCFTEKGHYFNSVARDRKVRGALASRIKGYTHFLDNPETIYQILARAEDDVDEKEEKLARLKSSAVKC